MTTEAFNAVRNSSEPQGFTASSMPSRETSTHIVFDINVVMSAGMEKGTLMIPRTYTPATPFTAYDADKAPNAIAPNAFVYIGHGARDDVLLPFFARYHAKDKVAQAAAPRLVAA